MFHSENPYSHEFGPERFRWTSQCFFVTHLALLRMSSLAIPRSTASCKETCAGEVIVIFFHLERVEVSFVSRSFASMDDTVICIWCVSKNKSTPKSSILIGFSIINHPFSHFRALLFLETPIWCVPKSSKNVMVSTRTMDSKSNHWGPLRTCPFCAKILTLWVSQGCKDWERWWEM